jgi:transketolase
MQNQEILQSAADQARGLAIDAIHACSSGHLGLPLGAAEVGSVLFGHDLKVDPSDAQWINRDRFVLSAGHGSMFLYGWLHLADLIFQWKKSKTSGSCTVRLLAILNIWKPLVWNAPPVPSVREWGMQ